MSEEDDKPTSVVYDHCVRVYNEMLSQAREESEEGLVYEGHLTKLVTAHLKLATPRYTAVMQHLKNMGCVEQLRRGGGGSPSRWRLLREPDEDTFKSVESMNRPNSGKFAVVEQQLRDQNKRVLQLETQMKQMMQHMGDLRAEVVNCRESLHNHTQADPHPVGALS